MKELLLVAAVVGLATTGCAQNQLLGRRGCRGQACHITRSQVAPRPNIVRTACRQGGCCDDASCDEGGCEDTCCGDDCSGDVCYDDACRDDCCDSPCDSCQNCLGRGCGLCSRIAGNVASGFCPHSGGYPESYNFSPSPPSGQTAYPYYTTRGPRDFLQANPPSIGPY